MNLNWKESENQIWAEDERGKTLAVIDFPSIGKDLVEIIHTEVDPSLRGQGIAEKLTVSAAKKIQNSGRKAVLTCSYAIRWFSRHKDFESILADPQKEAEKAASLCGPACGMKHPK